MILLLALFLTITHGAPLISPGDAPAADYAFLGLRETAGQDPNTRTIWDIIWSCVATILACTWTALHPNIPGPYDSGWRGFKRRVVMTFYALIAPEVVSLWALLQYTGARQAMEDYNKTVAKSNPTKKTIIQSVDAWFFSLPQETDGKGRVEPWTMSHAFFVLMGGFLLYEDGIPIQVLNYTRLKKYIEDGTIYPPDITEDEIQDRSKGDFISKGLVVLQTSWFVVQCITRWSQKLPLSELEVVTLGFALLNGVTYGLWWHKPQDVSKAFRITKIANTEKDNDNLCEVDLEKEPVDSEVAGSQEPIPQTSDTPLSKPDAKVLPILPKSSEMLDQPPQPQIDLKTPEIAMKTKVATLPALYKKVRYIPKKLRDDRSKIDGTWRSVLWFYGVMVPFRLFYYSLYAFLKMMEPEPLIEDGALRVSMFGCDAVNDYKYGGILTASCVVGTLFGAVHLIAWWSHFPTYIEHLLWRIAAVYVTGYPSFFILLILILVFLSDYCNMPRALSSPSLSMIYKIIIWSGAAFYGIARSIILFDAILALRNLPPAVYQDVEWTVFIPHL